MLPKDEHERLMVYVNELIGEACKEHGCLPSDVMSYRKNRRVVRARTAVIVALRDGVRMNDYYLPLHVHLPSDPALDPADADAWSSLSFPIIGKCLGKHHTTILLAYNRACKKREQPQATEAVEPCPTAIAP